MVKAKWVEEKCGEGAAGGGEGATPRPLRVEENLGLGIIQSCQGQVQPAL